jgi:hypothetical protein
VESRGAPAGSADALADGPAAPSSGPSRCSTVPGCLTTRRDRGVRPLLGSRLPVRGTEGEGQLAEASYPTPCSSRSRCSAGRIACGLPRSGATVTSRSLSQWSFTDNEQGERAKREVRRQLARGNDIGLRGGYTIRVPKPPAATLAALLGNAYIAWRPELGPLRVAFLSTCSSD